MRRKSLVLSEPTWHQQGEKNLQSEASGAFLCELAYFWQVLMLFTNPDLKMKKTTTKQVFEYSIVLSMLLSLGTVLYCMRCIDDYANKDARLSSVVDILHAYTAKNMSGDSLARQLEIMKFKEDHFIEQLGIQSDWFIGYVTILFGIFGLIGFVFYESRFLEMKKANEDNKNSLESKYKEIDKDLKAKSKLLAIETVRIRSKHDHLAATLSLSLKRYGIALASKLSSISKEVNLATSATNPEKKEKFINDGITELSSFIGQFNLLIDNSDFLPQYLNPFKYDEAITFAGEIVKVGDPRIVKIVTEDLLPLIATIERLRPKE